VQGGCYQVPGAAFPAHTAQLQGGKHDAPAMRTASHVLYRALPAPGLWRSQRPG